MPESKPLTAAEEERLLTELRGRYDLAVNAWRDIRDQGKEDMRYVAGDPWDPKDRQARIGAGRPCLSLDELGQYFNQVINDVRANPRAIKFAPTGSGANDATATFYADKMREIEYRSKAQVAYTTAFENAVQRSYGWVRLKTKYRPKSFNQDIWIEAIPNPDNVLPDPAATRPTSSDMKFLFYSEAWAIEEFVRAYPKAKITSFGDYLGEPGYGAWVKDRSILLSEYWTVEQEDGELLLVQDPRTGQAIELFSTELEKMPERGVVLKRREESIPKVKQYLTNGVEILKVSDWAGKTIPFVSCFGKVIYVDEGSGAKRQLLSMTRLARDPYMLYCYYRTCEAELVGMTPKTPFVGYVGQFRTRQKEWQAANHEPQAYLEADPLTEATGQQILPLPQRQPYDPPIQALEIGAESARRAIQAAMGSSPLPTQAQRKNEKSGIALRQIEQTAQRGTYHFLDHYDDMICEVGVKAEDLMDKIIDTPRDEGIRTEEDTAKIVRVNDERQLAPGQQQPISTKGDFLVTVSTGPAFESQRQEAQDFSEAIVSGPTLGMVAQIAGPPAAAKLLSQSIRLRQLGPIGDQMAETISPKEEQGQPNPAQLAQENQQLKGMLQQAAQQMQEAEQKLQAKQIEQQGRLQQTAMQEQGETHREQLRIQSEAAQAQANNETKLAVAELTAKVDRLALFLEERARLGVQAHERDMAAMGHQQALEQQAMQPSPDATGEP